MAPQTGHAAHHGGHSRPGSRRDLWAGVTLAQRRRVSQRPGAGLYGSTLGAMQHGTEKNRHPQAHRPAQLSAAPFPTVWGRTGVSSSSLRVRSRLDQPGPLSAHLFPPQSLVGRGWGQTQGAPWRWSTQDTRLLLLLSLGARLDKSSQG